MNYTTDNNRNDNGEIFASCGKELLVDIITNPLDILGTCISVYESDGSCLLNICNSDWCNYLHKTSSKLNITSNGMCESICDKQFCNEIFDIEDAVDLECKTGIKIYSVPIKIGGKTIGRINLGYGDPPKDVSALNRIADISMLDIKQLIEISKEYKIQNQSAIELAKKNLRSASRIVASMVEKKRNHDYMMKSYNQLETMLEIRNKTILNTKKLLVKEKTKLIQAKTDLLKFSEAVNLIYNMVTSVLTSFDEIVNRIVSNLSKLIDVPVVAIGIIENDVFKGIIQIINNDLSRIETTTLKSHPCGIIYSQKKQFNLTGSLEKNYPIYMKDFQEMKSISGAPIINSKGKIYGSIITLNNIKKEISECDNILIEKFARFIGYEIERKSMERQMCHYQEMKILGQLTSGVAHEVRNPLNGILVITDALSNDLGGKNEYSKYIEHIRKQVMRLSDLMKDLLNLGRPIEKANMMNVSISKLISAAVNLWQQSTSFGMRQVVVTISQIAKDAIVYADKAKLEQVIINLLENACAHSNPEKNIIIEVGGNENQIKINVIDLGCGIKEEHFEHLFEPFFTTRKGGTGLGLGIVKGIVESHGGSIEIKNNCPPPGVCASVFLPVVDSGIIKSIVEENTVIADVKI